ncbi:hypothetical protein [Arthrobacter silvisoli]|uniref:hypothetical protein n=1 Tax=Arthrobacter silvisoli TaxID=2291022 RepID=UPI001B349F4C|nr:hypothetical protein [Arthrobacter silvisoli]
MTTISENDLRYYTRKIIERVKNGEMILRHQERRNRSHSGSASLIAVRATASVRRRPGSEPSAGGFPRCSTNQA